MQYAFVEYDNIASVKKAIDDMEGTNIGSYKLKVIQIVHVLRHYKSSKWHNTDI